MNVPALSFTALQTALAASITRGTFVDTKYYLYSQRAPGGKGRTPRAVYANSTILTTFSEIFTHGMQPIAVYLCTCTVSYVVASDLVSSPPDKAGMKEVGDWDFEDDSDLDEEEIFEDIDDSTSDVSSVQSVPSCTTAQFSQDEDACEVNRFLHDAFVMISGLTIMLSRCLKDLATQSQGFTTSCPQITLITNNL